MSANIAHERFRHEQGRSAKTNPSRPGHGGGHRSAATRVSGGFIKKHRRGAHATILGAAVAVLLIRGTTIAQKGQGDCCVVSRPCCEEGVDPFATNGDVLLPSSIVFGGLSDIDPISAGFFGFGSDLFQGTVDLIGLPRADLNEQGELEQCGTADTFVRRLAPVVCPGTEFPRPCNPVPIEIVSLSLSGSSPITVTFNGGQDPEEWVIAMGATQPQPRGVLDAILESPTGGTYTATLPVEVLLVFVRVDAVTPGPFDPDNDIRQLSGTIVDMGLPGPVPWSRIPPADGGFFCEPRGFDVQGPFFPGEPTPASAAEGIDCETCVSCSGAGCHGGPGHTHCICRPAPCPTSCAMESVPGLKFPFPSCVGPNFAPGTIKTSIPCNLSFPPGDCCGSSTVPPVMAGLFPCGFGLSLQVYVNPVDCDPLSAPNSAVGGVTGDDLVCIVNVTQDQCNTLNGTFRMGGNCSEQCGIIPAVSEWGVVLMVVLVLTVGTMAIRGRRARVSGG